MENTQSETIATQLRYSGVGVSPGRVIAPLIHMAPPVAAPPEGDPLVEEADAEVEKLEEQLAECSRVLREIRSKVEQAQNAAENAKDDLEGIKRDLDEKQAAIRKFREKEVSSGFSRAGTRWLTRR